MKTINQVSVFLENRPGQLAEILELLASNNVDILALNISETQDYGVMRIIVKNPEATSKILRDNGCVCALVPVFMFAVPNKQGGLKSLIDVITSHGLNVDYMYSMVDVRKDNAAIMIIAIDDVEKLEGLIDAGEVQAPIVDAANS